MTATLTKAPSITLTYGNVWYAPKGFTKEDFNRELSPEFFKNERVYLKTSQQLNRHDSEHAAGCQEALFELKFAELAWKQGKLRVSHVELECGPVDEWDGKDIYQYDYTLECEVAFV
ncbi:hypothetical protein OAL34_02765 [Synechococcus sp. AH-551-G03]|nr:hypothetical protein [Synechococcus sp. AH-551-G03]